MKPKVSENDEDADTDKAQQNYIGWHINKCNINIQYMCHGGLVVSALGMRTQRPRFQSRVAPLFHWVATLGKLFAHIASPVSQLQETGVQKGVFDA